MGRLLKGDGTGHLALANPGFPGANQRDEGNRGGVMAKRIGRPSLQYRYEHYDPR